jgi:hypothetical protein
VVIADFLNHVAIAAPRNAATTHSVTPSSASVGTTAIGTGVVAGAVASGTLFTPTAGRFLACFVSGAVTSTTPTGWTLDANGAAINNSGHYVWYRTSAAGSDVITTTHNAANYPILFDFYEFAAGSTFAKAAFATAVASGGAGPTLSALTGTNWTVGSLDTNTNSTGTWSTTWTTGTKLVDTFAAASGSEGYEYSLTAIDADTATTRAYSATFTTTSTGGSAERIVFAVAAVAGAAAAPRIRTIGKRR